MFNVAQKSKNVNNSKLNCIVPSQSAGGLVSYSLDYIELVKRDREESIQILILDIGACEIKKKRIK